jgi:TerC family integral membrane protein
MFATDVALAATAAGTDIDVTAAMWAGLALVVIAMLAIDFLAFGRGHVPGLRESAIWSIAWLGVALLFGVAWMAWQGTEAGSQYFAGYLLERALSLDNVFVFAVILSFFAVPAAAQPKLLEWGIALALLLRLAFILAGAALLSAFHATFYLFGVLLLYTAYKLARHSDVEYDPEANPGLRLVRLVVPMTKDYDGDRLLTRRRGRWMATPLVAAFVAVATADVIFAVDSVPAIFSITQEPFVVFAANAFAMLGLRAIYFLVVRMRERFVYLSYGLATILGFVGLKMLLVDLWHPHIGLSLGVIVIVLAATIVLSVRAAPGSGRPA